MKTEIIYGYGFPVACTDKKLKKFIKNHKDTILETFDGTKLYEEVMKDPDVFQNRYKDIDDAAIQLDYSCIENGATGAAAIIANVMTIETGIRFSAANASIACDTPASVVFDQCFPWMYSKIEKNLTEDKLEAICLTYMKELGIFLEPNTMRLEYLV